MKTLNIIAFVISIALTASAQEKKVYGHPLPLPTEQLKQPIKLNCGMTIKEWNRNKINIEHTEELCSLAHSEFFPFLEKKGIKIKNSAPFNWNISFLPNTTAYRGLNDMQYRFAYRSVRFLVWGYTDRDWSWTFSVDDSEHQEFDVTFVHETFHAMSMWYGVFDSHGKTFNERAIADEKLACEFTESLGFGR